MIWNSEGERTMAVETQKAKYKDPVLAEYKNNPLIEALPALLSDSEILSDMREENLQFDPSEREMEAKYRIHCLARLSQDFYQPMPQLFDIESRISVSLRQGYRNRNPLEPGYKVLANEGYEAAVENREIRTVPGYKPNATGFTIIGVSGVGKSTAVERVLHMYPQVIQHEEYHGEPLPLTQLVWLKLDCPYNGSLGGLCYSFFQTVDGILGTHLFDEHKKSKINVNSMLTSMVRVAHRYSLGVLVIDEIQHLSTAGSGSEAMLNFFVTLVNTIGVPVILIGTPKAMPILQGEFRQARRGSGHGDLVWSRMKPGDEEWQLLVDSMWEYQWTRREVALTDEIRDAIYQETQGIVVLAVILYILVQEDAILSERETFQIEDIHRVAKQKMVLVQPMLDALRKNDQKLIEKYPDIDTAFLEQFSREQWAKRVAAAPTRKETASALLSKLRKDLLPVFWNMGIPPEKGEEIIDRIVRETKSKDIRELTRMIWMVIQNGDHSKIDTGNLQPDEEDLRNKADYTAIAEDRNLGGDEW